MILVSIIWLPRPRHPDPGSVPDLPNPEPHCPVSWPDKKKGGWNETYLEPIRTAREGWRMWVPRRRWKRFLAIFFLPCPKPPPIYSFFFTKLCWKRHHGPRVMSRAATGVARGVSDRPRLLRHRPIYTMVVVFCQQVSRYSPRSFRMRKMGGGYRHLGCFSVV